jgi:hypothetical protein
VRKLGVPDLTTTVLTMTLTGLAADSRVVGGTGAGSVRRISALLAMLLGAVAGALLLRSASSRRCWPRRHSPLSSRWSRNEL